MDNADLIVAGWGVTKMGGSMVRLIGFKAIGIALVAEVFVFPILQSPHDVALIFRTCPLHTAWEFPQENGGSELLAAWHGCPDRADNTKNNNKHKYLLIQE